jgi:hypothetical protein
MQNITTTHNKTTRAINCIWAVAKNTFKQALRMKVAIVFIIMLLVLLPVLGLTATGDETIKGRLQTFVGYGLSLTSLLLCLLTIIISIYTITGDIKYMQIQSVITKPIRRYQLLLGKMFGVLMLDLLLLCIFSVIIYSLAVYLPVYFKATEDERVQLDNEFFTARSAIFVPAPDVSEQVQKRYTELEKLGQLPPGFTKEQIIDELTNQAQLAGRAADSGDVLYWQFDNLKPLTDYIFIRFKYDVPQGLPNMEIYGEWVVGDPQYIKDGRQVNTPIYDEVYKHSIQTFHEIAIPADAIPASGKLAVVFMNHTMNQTSVMFPANGVALLYKAGSFTGNFVRAMLLILLRLIFLASLGTLASTFVSFPVAILLSMSIFTTVTVSGFIIESFVFLSKNVSIIYSYTVKLLIQLLPQFDKFNPSKFIIDAQLLSWIDLGKCAIMMICIQSFLLLILSFVIFSRREIAAYQL